MVDWEGREVRLVKIQPEETMRAVMCEEFEEDEGGKVSVDCIVGPKEELGIGWEVRRVRLEMGDQGP